MVREVTEKVFLRGRSASDESQFREAPWAYTTHVIASQSFTARPRSHPQDRFWGEINAVLPQKLCFAPQIEIWITGS